MRTVADMLPYLAAGGHGQYAKAARFCLELALRYDNVTKYCFCHQQHTVCYSTAKWAGIWTYLSIEQTLMRYCKSSGGLSRGRLRSESSQKIWLLNLVHTTKVNQLSMEHLESGRSRPEHNDLLQRGRDLDCVKKFFTWFEEKLLGNTDSTKLVSFSTGLVSCDINCNEAESVGMHIQKTLDQGTITTKILLKHKSTTFASLKKKVRVGSNQKTAILQPFKLFNRLTVSSQRNLTVQQSLRYELTPLPTYFFDDNQLLRKPNKAQLGKHLKELVEITAVKGAVLVIDGG